MSEHFGVRRLAIVTAQIEAAREAAKPALTVEAFEKGDHAPKLNGLTLSAWRESHERWSSSVDVADAAIYAYVYLQDTAWRLTRTTIRAEDL